MFCMTANEAKTLSVNSSTAHNVSLSASCGMIAWSA